jgi:hypothetical protein
MIYFEGGTKFLQLADKAARTVVLLTERLDHYRGRGQQQITVKHVTTNNVTADQAIIADSVTTGVGRNVAPPALLAASSEAPMPILDEARQPDPLGVGEAPNPNDHQPHAKRLRRASVQSQIEANREALSCACGTRLSCLSDAWS